MSANSMNNYTGEQVQVNVYLTFVPLHRRLQLIHFHAVFKTVNISRTKDNLFIQGETLENQENSIKNRHKQCNERKRHDHGKNMIMKKYLYCRCHCISHLIKLPDVSTQGRIWTETSFPETASVTSPTILRPGYWSGPTTPGLYRRANLVTVNGWH